MSAIAAQYVREQLNAVLTTFLKVLDAFVSNRMRRAAAEAEHVRSRRPQDAQSQPINAQ
jgi:hypothetical protein